MLSVALTLSFFSVPSMLSMEKKGYIRGVRGTLMTWISGPSFSHKILCF